MEDVYIFYVNEITLKKVELLLDDEIREKFKFSYYKIFDISFAEKDRHFVNIFIIPELSYAEYDEIMKIIQYIIPTGFANFVLLHSTDDNSVLNMLYDRKIDALINLKENIDILKLSFKKMIFSYNEKYIKSSYLNDLEQITESFIHIGEYQDKELQSVFYESILMLAKSAEAKDEITGNHVRRIEYYVRALALEYGLDRRLAEHYGLSSILHDIGKLKIPDSILKKPAKLTFEEYEFMQKHTIFGYEILSSNRFYDVARDIALYHHEKWNGNGYPKGLKGNEIPLAAQFTSISDVFDALTSVRPYKQAWGFEDALDFIKSQSNKSFNPTIVELFCSLVDKNVIQNIMEELAD